MVTYVDEWKILWLRPSIRVNMRVNLSIMGLLFLGTPLEWEQAKHFLWRDEVLCSPGTFPP